MAPIYIKTDIATCETFNRVKHASCYASCLDDKLSCLFIFTWTFTISTRWCKKQAVCFCTDVEFLHVSRHYLNFSSHLLAPFFTVHLCATIFFIIASPIIMRLFQCIWLLGSLYNTILLLCACAYPKVGVPRTIYCELPQARTMIA